MSKETVVSTSVALPQEAWEFLNKTKGNSSVGDRLAGYSRWFMTRQASGGMMIEPEHMDYLAGLNKGRRFENSRDVVSAVEIALKRDDGQYSFTIKVDPTLVKSLEEAAAWQGLSGEQLLDMIVNQVMVNGWCYEFSPDNGRLLPFSKEDIDALSAALGKPVFTGAEVAAAAAKKLKPALVELPQKQAVA